MGYYDEDGKLPHRHLSHPHHHLLITNSNLTGHYHSFRSGIHKLADRITHPREHHHHIDVDIHKEGPSAPRPRPGDSSDAYVPNTVTIPCHHIRLGDFLILQGRPCQVIRISTSSATGQYRYLGVDLFTKQLHEESSFISNPAPSVVVQTMLGPVFKQYRVLDLQDGYVVAMTETGDVKQGLQIIDQSNLHGRLARAFESGRGSLRVLVLNDNGQELAVDMKVIHGSRL
jgi:hypothetical protein